MFLLLASTTHIAHASLYRFELIIFEYTNSQYSDSETWPTRPGEPDYGNALSYITGSSYKSGSSVNRGSYTFELEKPEQMILKKEARAIKRSSSRKLLLHTGWIQSMHTDKQARPIAIKIGKEYTRVETEPDMTGIYSDYTTPASKTVRLKQLEGTIKISISRYLHVWTDLLFRRPHGSSTVANNTGSENVQAFRYRDHRRMRSKELHYIDNPSFGILIYALPVK